MGGLTGNSSRGASGSVGTSTSFESLIELQEPVEQPPAQERRPNQRAFGRLNVFRGREWRLGRNRNRSRNRGVSLRARVRSLASLASRAAAGVSGVRKVAFSGFNLPTWRAERSFVSFVEMGGYSEPGSIYSEAKEEIAPKRSLGLHFAALDADLFNLTELANSGNVAEHVQVMDVFIENVTDFINDDLDGYNPTQEQLKSYNKKIKKLRTRFPNEAQRGCRVRKDILENKAYLENVKNYLARVDQLEALVIL
ncbi:MAG: hypothetical protein ABJF28_19425 [Nisaea sp.]|uniref:hypothetical protein n=1 Tax=Alphaproteobacteria TaxID=28211 RepID=UPI003263B738